MPTSHYCKGKWRDGPVSTCPRHQKLSKKQTNVYRGVGDPGGKSGGTKAPETSEGNAASSDSSPPKPAPGSGSKES
jgi:hypothetical protein